MGPGESKKSGGGGAIIPTVPCSRPIQRVIPPVVHPYRPPPPMPMPMPPAAPGYSPVIPAAAYPPPPGHYVPYYPGYAVPPPQMYNIPPPMPVPYSVPPPVVQPSPFSAPPRAIQNTVKDSYDRGSRRSSRDRDRYSSRDRHSSSSSRKRYERRSSRERDYRRERRSVDREDRHYRHQSRPNETSSSTPAAAVAVDLESPVDSRPSSPARGPSRKASELDQEEKVKQHLKLTPEQLLEQEMKVWTRSAPADLYYERDMSNPLILKATPRLQKLLDRFENEVLQDSVLASQKFPPYQPPKMSKSVASAKCRPSRGCCGSKKAEESASSDSSSSEDEEKDDDARSEALVWMKHRASQPYRLHADLWDNRPGELNDGPACRCSLKARKIGIRHGVYQGEEEEINIPKLDLATNNVDKLYHYRVTISPPTNFLVKRPTTISHDQHEFIFEGFSLFTTQPLKELPVCHVVRFSIKYSILYFPEKMPDNVTLRELKLFHRYFFDTLLELSDWDVQQRFFFMPRFVRDLSENGKEILSMNVVFAHLLDSYKDLVDEMDMMRYLQMSQLDWQNNVTEHVKGMLVTHPGMKPGAVRVDQLDREQDDANVIKYPDIVHFGTRPQQLCYAGNADYQKAWREYIKFRHLLANMPKPSYKDKSTLASMESKLNDMRVNIKMKRDIAVTVSSQGFKRTGLRTDIVQHGLLLSVLVNHLRLHASLDHFEQSIGYSFKNRSLLQLAMTHPSHKENYGTNPDHVRNALNNCGIRQPEYGDRRVHYATNRKRGINMLINIMSRFGKDTETESKVAHNERLEFLGDAVVEFVTSVHLFHMFPDLEEGGLATYRAALVQNQHLAVLAEVLGLEKYMLYAHGSDLCHDSELRHAMANCFEALMGAIYLDGGIDEADKVFAKALFGSEPELHETWTRFNPHPLQMQEPQGDRHWISAYPVLQKLAKFEEKTGIDFVNIRLLARAFYDRSLGYSNLTMGSNQRLEFLGDTVLQLVSSDYLYRYFPEHHEGHLSLLRSSIVNNRTQAVVCDDLGIPEFALFAVPKKELKIKDRADLLEAFLGALYVDKDLDYCRVFAEVCFFPRLQQFIVNQEWNDPKSKLQQCCLTLRTMDGREPDIPVYKVIESKGPTNTRVYTVAVYFRGDRLAKAEGHSIQMAEMNAAKLALEDCSHLFPHLNYQKKIVERSFLKQNKDLLRQTWEEEVRQKRREMGLDKVNEECSKRNAERLRLRQLEKQKEQPAEVLVSQQPVAKKRKLGIKETRIVKERAKTKEEEDEEEKEEGECSDDEDDEKKVQLVPYECIDSPEHS